MIRGYVDMKEKGNRIKGMDGLRGIAIIGITLFHMFPNVFKGGYLGVVLFFVLIICFNLFLKFLSYKFI